MRCMRREYLIIFGISIKWLWVNFIANRNITQSSKQWTAQANRVKKAAQIQLSVTSHWPSCLKSWFTLNAGVALWLQNIAEFFSNLSYSKISSNSVQGLLQVALQIGISKWNFVECLWQVWQHKNVSHNNLFL